jgi:hypothetical protein
VSYRHKHEFVNAEEIITVYTVNYTKPINTKWSITDC